MERKRATMDGNHAAAHVAYFYTDVAAISPIPPSSVMAEWRKPGLWREGKIYLEIRWRFPKCSRRPGPPGQFTAP